MKLIDINSINLPSFSANSANKVIRVHLQARLEHLIFTSLTLLVYSVSSLTCHPYTKPNDYLL